MTGYSPFYAATYQEILLKNKACNINFDVYEQFGVKLSEQAIHLLKWLLDVNPENRPTAKEAMNHIWFLSQMTPEEKKHHQIILRNQANLIKHHELYEFFEFSILFFFKKEKFSQKSLKNPNQLNY